MARRTWRILLWWRRGEQSRVGVGVGAEAGATLAGAAVGTAPAIASLGSNSNSNSGLRVSPCEELKHIVRNALLGIRWERKQQWKFVAESDERIARHLRNVEEALKGIRDVERKERI